MNFIIKQTLPKRKSWKSINLGETKLNGIVRTHEDIIHDNKVVIFKNWASEHFESDWYELAASYTSNDESTSRDIVLIKSMLKNNLTPSTKLVDVHCGGGRHLIKLAEEGIIGMGVEGADLLRKDAIKKIKQLDYPIKIISTSSGDIAKYAGSADIVTTLFNSMGYTFSMSDDVKRLKWMTKLLKPNGYFLLDIRAENFQKVNFCKEYNSKYVINLDFIKKDLKASVNTKKYWSNKTLAAEEKILLNDKDHTLVQHTSYGWRTYDQNELAKMLKEVGLVIESTKLDYYSSEENMGERQFLLCRKQN